MATFIEGKLADVEAKMEDTRAIYGEHAVSTDDALTTERVRELTTTIEAATNALEASYKQYMTNQGSDIKKLSA